MKTLLWLGLLLGLGVATCDSTSAAQPSRESRTAKSGSATMRGCLQRYEGHYILIDAAGMAQRLSDFGKLKPLLNHEVELTGTPAIRTIDTTQPGAASSAVEQHYFDVKTVQDLAATCQSPNR